MRCVSYRIRVSKNSGQNEEEAWEELSAIAKVVQQQPKRIAAEVLRIEPYTDGETALVAACGIGLSVETNVSERELLVMHGDQPIDQFNACRSRLLSISSRRDAPKGNGR